MRIYIYYMAITEMVARAIYSNTAVRVPRRKKSIGAMVLTTTATTTIEVAVVDGSSIRAAPSNTTVETIKSHIWRVAGFSELLLEA